MVTQNNVPDLVRSKNALIALAERLKVDPDELKNTLKATVCKPIKLRDGSTRQITDAEFLSFVVVCNTYKLNPILKEIYAYPDTKTGGIVPVVSTDGWNNLMTSHPDYATHYYSYPDDMERWTIPHGGKICPPWMDVHIVKKDGKELVIREFLDEVFRDLTYPNPWQTHTKRMLRHKVKIQGAREAFGFAGIYDQDEAERIIEAQEAVAPDAQTQLAMEEPKAISDQTPATPEPIAAQPETVVEPEPPEVNPDVGMAIEDALKAPAGSRISVTGVLLRYASRKVVRKKDKRTVEVTDYTIGDTATEQEMIVTMYGKPEKQIEAYALLVFRQVDVIQWNDGMRYIAKEVSCVDQEQETEV